VAIVEPAWQLLKDNLDSPHGVEYEELVEAWDIAHGAWLQLLDENVSLMRSEAELAQALEVAVGHLENTGEYATSHGVHSDTVEARKLLTRREDERMGVQEEGS
jgi:hypothetical protein